MSNVGYDMNADHALKAAGNRLHEALMANSGLKDWEAFRFSVQVLTAAMGYVPFGDGPNHLSDEETRAAIPRVEGMLALIEALDAKTARSSAPVSEAEPAPQAPSASRWKRLMRRFV